MKNLKKKFLIFFSRFWSILALVFLVCVFFWKFFLQGLIPIPGDFVVGVYYPWLDYKWGYSAGVPVKNPILADVVSFTYPMQMLGVDLIKKGQPPLWNSYILGGTPLLANFQSAPFSPTNFLYIFLDKLNGWSIQIILQHLLAAIFTYLLLRSWKVSRVSSVLGGIIFSFSGFNTIWSQWNGHTLAAAFIPLILLLQDRFLTTENLWYGAGISISLMFLFLSGYPQIAIYLLIAVLVLWFFRVYREKNWIKRSVLLFILFLIGLGLSAVQILPGAELLKYSQRGFELHPYEWTFLPLLKVITFIAPDFFGNHATANYWGPQDYTSNTGFVGIVALILSSISLSILRQKKEVLFAFVLLITSLIFAFPTPISLFLWKSGILGLNAASAHRSLVLFNLSIAIMSAFGFDFLSRNLNLKKRFLGLLIPALLIISFGIYAYFLKGEVTRGILISEVAFRNLIFPSAILFLSGLVILLKPSFKLLLVPLIIFELFRFGWKFTVFSPRSIIFPTTPVIDFLLSREKPYRVVADKVIPINLLMNYRIETLEGYDAVYPKATSEFIATINGGNEDKNTIRRYGIIENYNSDLLDDANVKYLVIKKDDTENYLKYKKFKVAFEDKSVVVLENLNVSPRAFFVGDPGLKNSKVEFQKYTNGESRIKVEAKKEGLLFVSNSYYPGWKALVDGEEVEISTKSIFMLIKIPTGVHEVRLVYRPESFYKGYKITLISFGLLILFLVLAKRYTLNRK